MLNFLFRGLLTFNSTFLLIIIYLVKEDVTLDTKISYLNRYQWFINYSGWISYSLYILILVSLTGISIILSSKLRSDRFKAGEIVNTEYANNSFLPSYLGYFFVALSINDFNTLIFIYMILFVFTFFSQALYFNPLFLIFGYKFYNVTTVKGMSFFLISKKDLREPKAIALKANRINSYTYIEGVNFELSYCKNKKI
ncbi:hypothetical protein KRX19_07010 [Cardiobacteriaceae bacterium TAE3-ERU3]|nr:hypothetical protein [Cardiobacteriaceae bacterium TAE3-ERU3]